MFLEDLPIHYDGLQKDILTSLDKAEEEFESIYPTFYQNLKDELDLSGDVDFVSSMLYLDTYYSFKDNSLSHKRLNKETEDQAKEYFKYYYDEGLFGDENINRVFTHYFLTSLLHDFYTKLQNYQDRAYSDKQVTQLKASLYFGEYKTAQVLLKALGEDYDFFPKYAEQIIFELYDRDTQPYVYASHNGVPLKLGGKAEKGHIMFNVFMDYICDRIYYGSIDDVKTGDEKY